MSSSSDVWFSSFITETVVLTEAVAVETDAVMVSSEYIHDLRQINRWCDISVTSVHSSQNRSKVHTGQSSYHFDQ